MDLVLVCHARARMQERRVSLREVWETAQTSTRTSPGRYNRIVAERDYPAYVVRVIYNEGRDERIIITVIRRRRRRGDDQ